MPAWVRAATLSLALLVALASSAKEVGPAAGPSVCFDPAAWEGRYPTEAVTHGGPALLDLPCVRNQLKAILPAAEYRTLQRILSVDTRVERIDHYLLVARCAAHNCPAHHGLAIIDVTSGEVIVGLYRRTNAGSSSHWYWRQTDPQTLPPGVLEKFFRRHTPN